jgi:putative ABC transport system ATP-binding protein
VGASSPPLFSFEAVGLAIGDVLVLDGIDAVIPAEGITVVLGPSGSGKSTLLRLCNKLAVPTSGRVCYRGTDLAGVDPRVHRRRVGMVFQRATLFPGTVRDNLAVADPAGGDDRFGRLLARVGLDPAMLDRQSEGLSGGQAQRATVARALATEPEALLMDEPTAALDVNSRHGMEHLAVDLARAGTPIVWVTHDLDQAERLADRSIVLLDGRVADETEAAAFRGGGRFHAGPHDPAGEDG